MKRPWSPEDTSTLKRMAQAGYSDWEIAEHLGFCRETVTRRRLAQGFTASLKLGWRRRFIRDARIAA